MGAWIETAKSLIRNGKPGVALCMGAWIETAPCKAVKSTGMSRSVWARGLKLSGAIDGKNAETSRSVWARGLKPRQLHH